MGHDHRDLGFDNELGKERLQLPTDLARGLVHRPDVSDQRKRKIAIWPHGDFRGQVRMPPNRYAQNITYAQRVLAGLRGH